MSFLFGRIVRFAAWRLAADRDAREAAMRAVRAAGAEAGRIARDEDPARAAGRSLRRALNAINARRDEG